MHLNLLSIAAYKKRNGTVYPSHMAWFAFSPANNSMLYLHHEMEMRAGGMYPISQDWWDVRGEYMEIEIEWVYAALTSREPGALQVYGLSLLSAKPRSGDPGICHKPALVMARDVADAIRKGVRMAHLKYPKEQGLSLIHI